MTWLMDVETTRKPINGTAQQERFWAELRDGTESILLEARAGTGKSTSCREGIWRLIDGNPLDSPVIRYCCFNRKIADDFASGCPTGVEVNTMHGFCLRAIGRAFSSRVDNHKTYLVLDQIPGGADLKRYLRKSISTVVSQAKNAGLMADSPEVRDDLASLIWRQDIETWNRTREVIDWTIEVLRRSAEMVEIVDFDDMLWLAAIHGVPFPSLDFLFIDEAQDLNPLQHALAGQMAGDGRLVAVGDPYQSIYAFRGADSESIPKLRDSFNLKTLPLTVSFRCPRSHVALASQLIPDFEAAPDAIEGDLLRVQSDSFDGGTPGDLVLCRANAPIVSACLGAIGRRRPAIVRGRAIGDQILQTLRRIGDHSTIPSLIAGLSRWAAKELEVLTAKDGSEPAVEALTDRISCLNAIASTCGSPAEIPGVISSLFADENAANRITFSSVHRAKGSEARNVFYIQIPYGEKRDKLRPPQQWELDQRRNLRYVALTRSLHSLTLITPNPRDRHESQDNQRDL